MLKNGQKMLKKVLQARPICTELHMSCCILPLFTFRSNLGAEGGTLFRDGGPRPRRDLLGSPLAGVLTAKSCIALRRGGHSVQHCSAAVLKRRCFFAFRSGTGMQVRHFPHCFIVFFTFRSGDGMTPSQGRTAFSMGVAPL